MNKKGARPSKRVSGRIGGEVLSEFISLPINDERRGAWLMRFANQFQAQVFKSVLAESDLKVVLATCTPEQLAEFRDSGIASTVHLLDNNSVCNLSESEFENGPVVIPQTVFADASLAIAHQLLDRFERFAGEISSQERYYLIDRQLRFWWEKMRKFPPSEVVFMDVPHMYYEWLIIALARQADIPVLVLAGDDHQFHVYLDSNLSPITAPGGRRPLDLMGEKVALSISGQLAPQDEILSRRARQDNSVRRLLRIFARVALVALSNPKKPYVNGYYIRRQRWMSFGPNTVLNEKLREAVFIARASRAKSTYRRGATFPPLAKLDSSFTYFPLPSSFEASLHPSCSPLDIRSMVSQAVGRLEHGQVLVVKEHPMQFRFRHHQRFARQLEDYRWLRSQPSVRLVDDRADHFWLIRNASQVACVSRSSSLFEALALGKKTLVFGKSMLTPSDRLIQVFSGWDDFEEKTARPGGICTGSASQAKALAREINMVLRKQSHDE